MAISSSRAGNGGFLENAVPLIKDCIGTQPLTIAFIPFASVGKDYEAYGTMVKEAFTALPYTINTVMPAEAGSVLENADVIMVGGGNTFKLLHDIYDNNLFKLIQNKIKQGTPYIGWSAGANISGRSIGTTNDMPIIQPPSFKAFGFLPFQINPHYINQPLNGHNGETRDQRLEEFAMLNPGIPIVGLPEGTALQLQNDHLHFIGDKEGVLFCSGTNRDVKKSIIAQNEDLSPMMLS